MPVTTRAAAAQRSAQEEKAARSPRGRRARKPALDYQREARDETQFGLIQERLQNNLYHLIVQAILWNQTRGREARPVLDALLRDYPTPYELSAADETTLSALLYPIGLYRQRARRLIALGHAMLLNPPIADRLFPARDRRYERGPCPGMIGWEIGHLPGVGPYALDSYRIFFRDQLRGLSTGWQAAPGSSYQPEWQRVVPTDKDLRAFLRWAWRREGYEWDPLTAKTRKIEN